MISGGLGMMIVLLALLWVVLYWLLDRHEKRRVANGKPRHSGIRLFFGAAGLLLLLFSGGCSLLFGLNADGTYVTWQSVSIIGGPPLVVGLLVAWLTLRRGQNG